MFWLFSESAEEAQAEALAASIDLEGSTVQASTKEPEEVRFAATSSAMEAAMTVTAPEVSATISASAAPVVGPTPARDDLISIPRSVMERGSGVHQQNSPQPAISWENWRVRWCSSSLLPCDHVLTSSCLGAALSNSPECFWEI